MVNIATNSGWLTRSNLESLIPTYGPAALNAQQTALEEAKKRAREVEGSKRSIGFVNAKRTDKATDVEEGWERRQRNGTRDKERQRDRERSHTDRSRDRARGRGDRDR